MWIECVLWIHVLDISLWDFNKPIRIWWCSYVPEPDDMAVLKIAYKLYCKFSKYPEALRVALRMGNTQVCR